MKTISLADLSIEELGKMSIAELEKHSQEIYLVSQAVKAEAKQVASVIDSKSKKQEVLIKHKFDRLPKEKQEALLQVLSGDNVKSSGSVHEG